MKRLENTNDRKVRKIYPSTSSKGLDGFRFFLWTVLERNPEGFKTIWNPFERCRLRFRQEWSESMRARHLMATVASSALIVPSHVSLPVQHPADVHTDKRWRNRRKETVQENCDLSPGVIVAKEPSLVQHFGCEASSFMDQSKMFSSLKILSSYFLSGCPWERLLMHNLILLSLICHLKYLLGDQIVRWKSNDYGWSIYRFLQANSS